MSLRDVTYAHGGVGYAPPASSSMIALVFVAHDDLRAEQRRHRRRQSVHRAASAIVSGGTWKFAPTLTMAAAVGHRPGQYNDLGAQLNYRIVSVRAVDGGRPTPPPPAMPPVTVTPASGTAACLEQ